MKRLMRVLLSGYWVVLFSALFLLPSQGMALEPGLYIPDLDHGIVYKMDLEDRSLSAFYPKTGQVQGPYFLEQDGDGNLIVSIIYSNQIVRVSPEGDFVETIASGLSGNHGMALDSSGNLYVAEYEASRVTRISPSGEKNTIAVELGGTADLEFDSDENLYISSVGIDYPPDPGTGKIFRISNDQLKAFIPGYPVTAEPVLEGLDYPIGIEYREGKLYICEWANHEILSLDLSSYNVSVYFSGIIRPSGIDSSDEGDLYVGQNNVVGMIDAALNYTVLATGLGSVGGVLYVPAIHIPTITGLNPTSIMAGSSDFILTVYGTNFSPGAIVQWNKSDRATTYVSSTEVRATITAADIALPGTANIAVSNPPPGGGLSNSLLFSIVNPVPRVTSLSPSSAFAGGADFTLTVYGAGFVPGSVVLWNNSNRKTTFISRSELRASIAAADIAAPGTVNIAVSNPPPGGGLSNSLPFSIVSPAPNPVPTVTSLNPSSALTGGADFTLTVTGTNFVQKSVLRWNGLNRSTIFVSNTQIQASISADDIDDPGIMNINVFNPLPGGGSSNSLPFRIKIPTRVELTVDSIFVSSGTQYVKLKARVIDTMTGQTIYGIGYRYIYTYFYLDRRYIGMSRVNQSGTYAGYSVISYKAKTGAHLAKAVFNEDEKYGGSEAEIQFTAP